MQRLMSACAIWHEGEAGSNAEDVAGAHLVFLEEVRRDVTRVVIWVNNCAGQNKSWALMSRRSSEGDPLATNEDEDDHDEVFRARAHEHVGGRQTRSLE